MSDTPVERRRQPTPGDLSSVRQDMANIAEAVDALAQQTAALPDKEDVRHNTRQIVATVVVGIAVLVIAVALPLWLDRRDDQRSAEQRERLERVANEIESCTTPEGECSKRSAAGQARAVQELRLSTVFAGYCAIQNTDADSPDVIEECVAAELARYAAENPPPPTTTTTTPPAEPPVDESDDWPLGAIVPPLLILAVLAVSFGIRKYQTRARSPEGDDLT